MCRSIDMACWIAMVLMLLKVFLMGFIGISNFSLRRVIDGMCVVALAPVVMTMSGSTFHPLAMMLLISGWYLSILFSIVSDENLSLQYVNSMNCIVRSGLMLFGGGSLYGSPRTHNISSLNLPLQWHLWVPHVQDRSHAGDWNLHL